jgi:hypothetical protein
VLQSFSAGEGFGDEGWTAVAEALSPRLNPDGNLVHPPSIDTFKLLSMRTTPLNTSTRSYTPTMVALFLHH